jgi:UDP-N-acetylglucosamine 1-carboxyvinyltransferase
MMASGEVVLENVPTISDILVLADILRGLGARVEWLERGLMSITPPTQAGGEGATYPEVKKLRASSLLLGPLLARYGRARVALPGGCNIGIRPMDLHFKGLVGLGADLSLEHGCIGAESSGLKGARIYLDFPSVGATENIMMAACLAKGQTVIENVAKEPELVDLANFLNSMGARVRGAGTDVIKVEGADGLSGGRYSIIPDRIEAGTFMVAAAASRGEVTVENVIPFHLQPVTAKLREAGIGVVEQEDKILVSGSLPYQNIDIKTMPYPGFPTDMQSPMMAMLCTVPGLSLITENIFENRFQVVNELKRMGANIKVEGRVAVIEGVPEIQGAQVRATDLRAGAALIVAGLLANGETEISNAELIYRGYEDLVDKLSGLGASIRGEGGEDTVDADWS